MKTRVNDLPTGFSFEYSEVRHPLPRDWHAVGGDASSAAWSTAQQRDRARACFTHRRTVAAAFADLRAAGLVP